MSKDIFNRDMLLIMTARFLEEEYCNGAVEALAEYKNARNRERWREIAKETGRSDPEYLFRLFTDRVHEYDVMRKSREALEVIVTKCAHAETFQGFNAADVGMKMICMGDYAVVEGFNPKIRFKRPKTLMAGDEYCHFIFELE
jgi:predicted ArsR family transcriptional regulator